MLRFLLFSEAAQPVEIDKKHYKWHVTNNNIFQLQQRVSNALKFIQNFNYNKRKINFRVRVFGCFVFEFWVLHFRSRGLHFRVFGGFVFELRVLRFRDLGASCFSLRIRNYLYSGMSLHWTEFLPKALDTSPGQVHPPSYKTHLKLPWPMFTLWF